MCIGVTVCVWSAVRIHLHLCFVPTNLKLLSAKQNKISDKLLLDKTCCYLFKVLSIPSLHHPTPLLWASKCNNKSEQTLPLLSHTCIQYAYSLVWSGSVNRRRTHTHWFFFFFATCQSVSLHHHNHHHHHHRHRQYPSSICQPVCQSYLFVPLPNKHTPFFIRLPLPRLLSCSQLLLQHFPHLC